MFLRLIPTLLLVSCQKFGVGDNAISICVQIYFAKSLYILDLCKEGP
jgi:hypothetical protein